MEQKENKNVLNIDIPAEVSEGVYTNMTIVSHSQEEFVMDFVRIVPASNKAKVKSRVVMSPANAKRTLAALQENIMKYEAQYGTIKLPERKQAPSMIAPFKAEA